jgi:hypothetical protein
MTATEQGAADFLGDRHMNPYSWSKEHASFVVWIVDYQGSQGHLAVITVHNTLTGKDFATYANLQARGGRLQVHERHRAEVRPARDLQGHSRRSISRCICRSAEYGKRIVGSLTIVPMNSRSPSIVKMSRCDKVKLWAGCTSNA